MDKRKFVKRVMIWTAIVLVAVFLVIGLCFGKVIEGSLFAEVAKWVFMAALVIGGIELFVGYIIAPLIWHFTYGRGKE